MAIAGLCLSCWRLRIFFHLFLDEVHHHIKWDFKALPFLAAGAGTAVSTASPGLLVFLGAPKLDKLVLILMEQLFLG